MIRSIPNRLCAGICLLLLYGCSTLQPLNVLDSAPLPTPDILPCCWQSVESVEARLPDGTMTLTAAISLQPGTLTVVLLDAVGRRLLTITQHGDQMQTTAVAEMALEQQSRALLLAIYLHQLAADQWPTTETDWQVSSGEGYTELRKSSDVLIHVAYPGASARNYREVSFTGTPMHFSISTLSEARVAP